MLMGEVLSLDCEGSGGWCPTAIYYILHDSMIQET